jgi:hypothetical protein
VSAFGTLVHTLDRAAMVPEVRARYLGVPCWSAQVTLSAREAG